MKAAKERSQAGPEGPLSDVLVPETYQQERQQVFRSQPSLKYFMGKHRVELFRRGALIEVGGRLLIVRERFDAAVLELSSAPRASSTGKA